MRYIVITCKNDNKIIFEQLSAELKNILTASEINSRNKILLKISPQFQNASYTSIEEITTSSQPENIQFIVEYNETNHFVTAIYDCFFTQANNNNYYRLEVNNLFLHQGKYADQTLSMDRLMTSIAYGILKELCMRNSANKDVYHRGLIMMEYLYRNPPAELYRITKKSVTTNQGIKFLLEKAYGEDSLWVNQISKEINLQHQIPQINFDRFDIDEMRYALENVGTFELLGSAVDRLKSAAEAALVLCKDILNLPKTELNKTPNKGFNGFQNVRKESKEKVKINNGKGIVRNQIAFHCKPYLGMKSPGNLSLKPYAEYYEQSLTLLHILYRYIAVSFKIHPDEFIDYLNDQKSVLTTRKYFPKKEGETGIPPHSDYGLLTLVVSDERGLEVERDGKWYAAPHKPGLRFFVNFGDWFGFQLRNLGIACKMGIHRVPEVDLVRHSLASFLNPSKTHVVKVPNGEEIPYETYLTSPKVPYIIAKPK